MYEDPAYGPIRESNSASKTVGSTDMFSARTMTRSHPVFGKMTLQQYGNDRLMRQRGSRESGQEAAGPGRVGGAWQKVLSVRMDRTVYGGCVSFCFITLQKSFLQIEGLWQP